MAYLLSYTRLPIDNILYDPRLAYSMHLALSEDGETYQALNHNSGVLFVKATDNEDGSVTPWSLINPVMFAMEDGYGVIAQRIGSEGDVKVRLIYGFVTAICENVNIVLL